MIQRLAVSDFLCHDLQFSKRNSEALNAPDNSDYDSANRDDYATWGGEAQLVQWGTGKVPVTDAHHR